MESQHMTQQTFSDFIGISSASLSSIFNGRTKPTLNTVEAIRSKFTKISLDWLMFGKGPMFTDQDDAQASQNGSSVVPTAEGLIDFDGSAAAQPVSNSGQRSASSLPRQAANVQSQISGYKAPSTPQRIDMNIIADACKMNNRRRDMNIIDKPQRRITEIRIFFDDQTWETFLPKK